MAPPCAPSWLRRPHEDFTLIWILSLRDFWAATGETELIESLWPTLLNIWKSPAWGPEEAGLWGTAGKHLFIDWGVLRQERGGRANAVLNLLRFGALKASAELAGALDLEPAAEAFRLQAARVEAAILDLLWIEEQGRLAPFLGGLSPGLHANILALAFEAGSPSQRQGILAHLEPLL